MNFCAGRSGLAVLAMAFVALGAPAQNEGDGQSAGRARGRDRAAEKQAWFLSGRTPLGESAADLLRRAFVQKELMRVGPDGQAAGRDDTTQFPQLQWTSLGPRPIDSDPTLFQSYGFVTGRVTSIAVDQKDPTGNTVYVGSANGGVWKSTNAAAADPSTIQWQPLTDKQPSLAIGALALQPGASANVILAGTGEANNTSDSYYGMGFLRSTDGGQTWSLVASANSGTRPFRGLSISRIAFHTANTDVVVAGASSSNGGLNGADLQSEAGRGIYYSLNAGGAWTYASMVDGGTAMQASAVTDVVFSAVQNRFYAAVRGHGYYESTNGQSWNRMAQQPGASLSASNCPATTDASTCPLVRGQLAAREGSAEVYAAWVDADNHLSLYKLTSSGAAWQQLGQAGIDNCGDPGPDAGCGAQQGSYNLTLRAIPNGDATDLYFGALNLFKCTVSVIDQTCTSPGAWKNLTHAYGCSPLGAPAHVHPGQHAIDFVGADAARIFFGNDGGVYRSLNGYGLISSSCGVSNGFDNLNANLGPLSQFVSLAQPADDVGLLLGGVLANGSPVFQASDAGTSGTMWRAVNLGDGGYSAIDPGNANVFYTSFPAGDSATIQRCAIGANCRQNTWANVAETASFGNDSSAYFLPYLLDPKNPATLLAGTCRVWRGPAGGGTFTAISSIFAAGGATVCDGGTASGESKIRSLAAGGPTATSGNAKVIYAGMVGRNGGTAGDIFVTTDSDAGTASWQKRTGGINPSGYDVSDIIVSSFDATGNTAYATIMGFGVAHIFKTTNAGVSWVSKNGNLPDMPVNSIAIDPLDSALLYAGTDLGVFVSADDGGTWSELGSGMPNVPVMKLMTFVSSGTRKLRAATFGRGVWQIDLPVTAVKVSPAAMTFNPTVVGRKSGVLSTVLTNDTLAPITFTSINASGAFAVQHDCPPSLAVSTSCNLAVTFQPNNAGLQNSVLNVNYNAGTLGVPLSGVGVDFSLLLARPKRPIRNGGGSIIVPAFGGATFEVTVETTSPMDMSELVITCTSPVKAVRCSVSPLASSDQTAKLVRVELQAVSRPHPQRLSGITGLKSITYVVSIEARLGALTRLLKVSFQIP